MDIERSKKMLALTATILLVVGILPHTPLARAENTSCTTGDLAGTFHNIIVPSGATCILSSSVWVKGNVKVESGGSFSAFEMHIDGDVHTNGAADIAISGVTVGKNIHINDATNVALSALTVGGNVHIKRSTLQANIFVAWVTVGGNIEIEDQSGGSIELTANQVGGNVKLEKNQTALDTPPSLDSNTIGGNLDCEKNSPAPFPTGSN